MDVDITMSCRIEVDAENEEQAKEIVGIRIGNVPWCYVKNGHYVSHEFEAVSEQEPEPVEKLSFSELCDKLQYFSVINNQQKTIGDIAEECREYIRKHGHECLDDCYDEEKEAVEWMEKHHPEIEWTESTAVLYQPLEFLCLDEYTDEPRFAELCISFYGDYDNGVGVFSVTND